MPFPNKEELKEILNDYLKVKQGQWRSTGSTVLYFATLTYSSDENKRIAACKALMKIIDGATDTAKLAEVCKELDKDNLNDTLFAKYRHFIRHRILQQLNEGTVKKGFLDQLATRRKILPPGQLKKDFKFNPGQEEGMNQLIVLGHKECIDFKYGDKIPVQYGSNDEYFKLFLEARNAEIAAYMTPENKLEYLKAVNLDSFLGKLGKSVDELEKAAKASADNSPKKSGVTSFWRDKASGTKAESKEHKKEANKKDDDEDNDWDNNSAPADNTRSKTAAL